MTGPALPPVAGVIGWPVAHSLSPRLHRYWLRRYRIEGHYLPFPVQRDAVAAALDGLRALGLAGVNVTVPHKEAALANCDSVDDQARRIGAVNTVVVNDAGELIGSNTDGFGFIESIRNNSDWSADHGPALVLGAGGAARGVVVALLDAGVPAVRITNRTRSRAEAFAAEFGERISVVDWDLRADALADIGLLVNTTTLGMQGHDPLDLDLSDLAKDAVVNDIVYTPLQTSLLRDAVARGNPVVDGLGMLLYQAQPGFEKWFGVRPDVDAALRRFVLEDLT